MAIYFAVPYRLGSPGGRRRQGWQSNFKQGICIILSCSAELIHKFFFQEHFSSLALGIITFWSASASNGVEICKYVPQRCRWGWLHGEWQIVPPRRVCVFSICWGCGFPPPTFLLPFGSEALSWPGRSYKANSWDSTPQQAYLHLLYGILLGKINPAESPFTVPGPNQSINQSTCLHAILKVEIVRHLVASLHGSINQRVLLPLPLLKCGISVTRKDVFPVVR